MLRPYIILIVISCIVLYFCIRNAPDYPYDEEDL